VFSGLCDGLITRLKESYRVCVSVIEFDLETSTKKRPRPSGAVEIREKKITLFSVKYLDECAR
jgi:hypothetical protein